MDTTTGSANPPPTKTSLKKGVGTILYYGFAIDSISRSLSRAKRSLTQTGGGVLSLVRFIFKERSRVVAVTHEEVVTTMMSSAHSIVASLIFTMIFLLISIFKDQGIFATVLNLMISLSFFIVMLSHSFVYLKAKELMNSEKLGHENTGIKQ